MCKWLKRVIAVSFLLFICTILFIKWEHQWAMETEQRQAQRLELERRLFAATTESDSTQPVQRIALAALTDFEWDHVYVYGAYTDPSMIYEQLGYHWYNQAVTNIQYLDNHTLLVFVSNGKAVEYLEYPLGKGVFSWEEGHNFFTKREALFHSSTKTIVDEHNQPIGTYRSIEPVKE